MPKQIDEQDLETIEQLITACSKGIGITELETALSAAGIIMNRRSLLRRMSILIESNRIRATGAFKGRIYWPLASPVSDGQGAEESVIPLSLAGREIRGYVSQPIQRREPIGYTKGILPGFVCGLRSLPHGKEREELNIE